MKSTMTMAALLTLSVTSATVWTSALYAAPPVNPENNSTMTPAVQQHDQVDPTTASEIRSRLANIVSSAVTVNGFSDLIADLAKPNRDRIGTDQPNNYSVLNSRIAEFRKDFHDKYNQDFDLNSVQFNDLKIFRGADKDHAAVMLTSLNAGMQHKTPAPGQPLSSNTPSGAVGNPRGDDKHPTQVIVTEVKSDGTVTDTRIPADQIRNPDFAIESPSGGMPQVVTTDNPSRIDTGLGTSSGTYITTARPQNLGMVAPMQLSLINENTMGRDWRLEAPDSLTAQSLSDALAKHLKVLCDNSKSWPNDVNEAYRAVSGHVFQAIQEVPAANISSEK